VWFDGVVLEFSRVLRHNPVAAYRPEVSCKPHEYCVSMPDKFKKTSLTRSVALPAIKALRGFASGES
jgi:hypothetical protein